MSLGSPAAAAEFGPSGYALLQQELIALKARLDRQISQLIRLNQLSNRLIRVDDGQGVANLYAESIIDVLDLAVGVVWIFGDPCLEQTLCGVSGTAYADAWLAVGGRLADQLEQAGERRAIRLDAEVIALLPSHDLADVIACRCINREGQCNGIVLTANTTALAGMFDPVSDDTFEIVTLLAEKFAAHLDIMADQRVIRRQVNQLKRSEERLQLVLRGTNDGWWDWDLIEGQCFLSVRWLQMMGYEATQAEELGHFWRDRIHPADRGMFDLAFRRALAGERDGVEAEIRLLRENNVYLPVLVRGTITRDAGQTPMRFTGSILDLTERKRHEAHVHRLAFYDSLTELPNRLLLIDRVQQSLLSSSRTHQIIALMMIDLDRFKTLNDTYGHAAGDQLLCSVGRRLRESVRSTDTVARLSGDEFVVLLENLGTDSHAAIRKAEQVALKILQAFNKPYSIDVGVTHHSASIGLAVVLEEGLTVETLLQRADVALYEAKAAGRNTVRLFHREMQQRVDRRSVLEVQLREGFEKHELKVAYQAQVDAKGNLYSAEALMRWQPLQHNPVAPAEFIPVAEESGLIHSLGHWTLEQVCDQLLEWENMLSSTFRISVNLSEAEFLHPDFPERILDTLARKRVSGSRLRLEITEESVLTELDYAAARMHLLRDHGIEFSLDDFGTGYSSLTYLRRLPVSEVKIDRSYVRSFPNDHNDAAIVRAIVNLASSLRLRVVAEGVETEDQAQCLLAEGCQYFQGFYFGHPVFPSQDPQSLCLPRPNWKPPQALSDVHPGIVR
jgi:diguanylate cyclase (GGDEF)-like protein/PAS domain S-box-containing protein